MSSDQLTLFAVDSLASHTVLPGSDAARQMTVSSGRNIAALLTLSGPVGLLVKMCLTSEQLFSMIYSLTWKVWTTPQRRSLFRLVALTRRNFDTGYLSWPTPKASPSGPDFARMNRPESGGDDLPTAIARQNPGPLNPEWVEWLMGFPIGWTDLER